MLRFEILDEIKLIR